MLTTTYVHVSDSEYVVFRSGSTYVRVNLFNVFFAAAERAV